MPQHRSDPTPAPAAHPIVVSVTRGACELWLPDGQTVAAELSAELSQVQRTAVAVGDLVTLTPRQGAGPLITNVLPRRTTLSRPDPMAPRIQRVIVANVDDVVVVCATRRPALKLRLIDRYFIAVQQGGARTVVVINKIELLSPGRRTALEQDLAPYRALGLPVHLCSAHDGEGLQDLTATLVGRTCAFVGHSGVGKSSLLNGLLGRQTAAIGDVRSGDGKGRHTTTTSVLHALPGGTHIIDTPGIRAFGLWGLSRDQLRHSFPDFDDCHCHYADCMHDAEPVADCGVKRAVAGGSVGRARYDTYLRLLADLPKSSR